MATLSDADRFDLWAEFMRDPRVGQLGAVLKGDIRGAINGADDYLSSNAVAMKNAIPQPARSELSNAQIALIYTAAIYKRYLRGL